MSTTHFLDARVEAFEARHEQAIKDSLPYEATIDYFFDCWAAIKKWELTRAIGLNMVVLGTLHLLLPYLGMSELHTAIAGLVSVIVVSLAYMKIALSIQSQREIDAHLERSVQARRSLHTVRRYEWCVRMLMQKARRIGLLLDYFQLYALVVDQKDPGKGFALKVGNIDFDELMNKSDVSNEYDRTSVVKATMQYIREAIEEVNQIADVNDRRMISTIWDLRDTQDFWEMFTAMMEDLTSRIMGLNAKVVADASVIEDDVVKKISDLGSSMESEGHQIGYEIRALADIVEPLFCKSGPMDIDDKLTQEAFDKARGEIEALAS